MKLETPRQRTPSRFLVGFALIVAGCGGNEGPPVFPVSGKVLVDGKPAAKALVTFHPSWNPAGKLLPYAETDTDGTFRPGTRLTGDGAPAGDYTLTITWPEITIDHGEEISGRDRLRGLYRDPATSGLKVTIKQGENSLPPFDLKAAGRANLPRGDR